MTNWIELNSESTSGTWELGTFILHTQFSLETKYVIIVIDVIQIVLINIIYDNNLHSCLLPTNLETYYNRWLTFVWTGTSPQDHDHDHPEHHHDHDQHRVDHIWPRWPASVWVATPGILLRGKCSPSASRRGGLRWFSLLLSASSSSSFTSGSRSWSSLLFASFLSASASSLFTSS